MEDRLDTDEDGTPDTAARTHLLGHQIIAQADTSGMYYLLLDGHGSTRALTDPAGQPAETYAYTAFGEPIGFDANTAKTNWLFAGDGIWDAKSQMTYHLARWRDGARFISYDSYEADPGAPAALHKYLYTSHNPVHAWDPSGQIGLVGRLVVIAGIGLLATLTLPFTAPLVTATYRRDYTTVGQNSWKRQYIRDSDDILATYPWFIRDTDDWLFPSTPSGVIRAHRSTIRQQPVPPELLASVLLAELRHYNLYDTLFDGRGPDAGSCGIAQIRPRTIEEHSMLRPDIFGGITRDIMFHAANAGIDLNTWYTATEYERETMVGGFTSAKDTDRYIGHRPDQTQFGLYWGVDSYRVIKAKKMLGD